MISKHGVQPITDLSNTKETIIGKWWTRPCVTANTPEGRTIDFTREEIILTLADKEGGAHVDELLPEHYRRYIVNADIATFNSRQEIGTVHQARYARADSYVCAKCSSAFCICGSSAPSSYKFVIG